MLRLVGLFICVLAGTCLLGGATATHIARPLGYLPGSPYGYLEYLPAAYGEQPAKRFPVVIFLHGLGEQSADQTKIFAKVSQHGPHKLVKNGNTFFDDQEVLLLSPMSPSWWNSTTIDHFIDALETFYRIDANRIYITGLSMGGGGTFDYGRDHPGRPAAVVPICSAIGAINGAAYVDLPVWAFHAWGDPTVTRNNTINYMNSIVTALDPAATGLVLDGYPHVEGDPTKAAATTMTASYAAADGWLWETGIVRHGDRHPRMTLYTTNSHDSWTATYHATTMWQWLLAKVRPGPSVTISGPRSFVIAQGQVLASSATATAHDGTDLTATIAWRSNLDGDLGTGGSLSTTTLLPGTHTIRATVTDAGGRCSSDFLVVEVTGILARHILVDFGAPDLASANRYNNITATNGSVLATVDTCGETTAVNIRITNAFAGSNGFGVDDATLYAATAQRDTLWIDPNATNGTDQAQVTIEGLDPLHTYAIACFASRQANDNRTTDYSIGSQTQSLNAAGNTDRRATFTGVVPDGMGTIVLEIRVGTGALYGYLGVLDIVDESMAPVPRLIRMDLPPGVGRWEVIAPDHAVIDPPTAGTQVIHLGAAQDAVFAPSTAPVSPG